MDFDHMDDTEFMAWFEREYPADENGNRTRYRDTMVMDLMHAAFRARRPCASARRAGQVADAVYGFGSLSWEMAYEVADAVLELFGESK